VRTLRGDLLHYTYRSIADHLRTIDRFTARGRTGDARTRQRCGAALAGLLLHPPAKFLKMYLLKAGFLDGTAGLIIAVLGSYYVFLKYAKLWEWHQREKKGGPDGNQ